MERSRPRRPSPALVVSIVALMVALGGVARAEFTSTVQHRLFDKLGTITNVLRDTNADQNGDSAHELSKLDRLRDDLKAHEDRLESVQVEVERVLVTVDQMDKKLGELDTKLASVDVEQRDVVEPVLGALCEGQNLIGFGTAISFALHNFASDRAIKIVGSVLDLPSKPRWAACNAVRPPPPG